MVNPQKSVWDRLTATAQHGGHPHNTDRWRSNSSQVRLLRARQGGERKRAMEDRLRKFRMVNNVKYHRMHEFHKIDRRPVMLSGGR